MMKTKWFYGQIALLIVLFIAAPLLFVVFAALFAIYLVYNWQT